MKKFLGMTTPASLVTSIMPTVIGFLFAFSYYHVFNWQDSVILFIAVVSFHMAVNAWDQFADSTRLKNDSYNNNLAKIGISAHYAKTVIWTLVIISTVLGVYLVYRTGWPLLIIGLISFAVGYFYAGGPKPISSTPFGELFAGLTMGYNITLLGAYVNTYQLNPSGLYWKVLIVAIPAILTISNILLANNICDYKEDVEMGRKTIVAYAGQKGALHIWNYSYLFAYLGILLAIILQLVPPFALAVAFTIPTVNKKVKRFNREQIKSKTFMVSIIIAVDILVAYALTIGLGMFIK